MNAHCKPTTASGNPSVTLGLFCSVKCPGGVILKLYDVMRELRDAGVVVIGGFQSPMERECLDILLRGEQRVVVVLARTRRRFPEEWKGAIEEGRLVVVQSEEETTSRITAAMSARRNQRVAEMADALLVAYAAAGGQTDALTRWALLTGKRVWTINDEANAELMGLGAVVLDGEGVRGGVAGGRNQ